MHLKCRVDLTVYQCGFLGSVIFMECGSLLASWRCLIDEHCRVHEQYVWRCRLTVLVKDPMRNCCFVTLWCKCVHVFWLQSALLAFNLIPACVPVLIPQYLVKAEHLGMAVHIGNNEVLCIFTVVLIYKFCWSHAVWLCGCCYTILVLAVTVHIHLVKTWSVRWYGLQRGWCCHIGVNWCWCMYRCMAIQISRWESLHRDKKVIIAA
jgi:hypothetical protein